MPRPMNVSNEKSKNFFGSIKRLFVNLKSWMFIMVISLTLAIISAIFSIIAPDILSDFADLISDGLKPNTENLTEISTKITDNFKNINYEEKMLEIKQSVDDEDFNKFSEIMSEIKNVSKKDETLYLLIKLPDSVLNILIDDISYNKNIITVDDQIEYLKILSKMNEANSKDQLKLFDELPKSIYNLVKPTIDMDKIKKVVLILVVLYLLSSIFSYIQSFGLSTVSNNFAKKLRAKITNKINVLPLKYFDAHENGDILSRVTNDVDTIAMNMNQSLATLVSSITLFLGSIIMMFVTNWIMAFTAIISSLLGFVLMISILKNSQKYFSKKQEELGKLNGYIEEIYSGHNVVKAYNGDKLARQTFSELNKNLYEANKKSQFLSGLMQPIMGFIGNFGYVCVCVVGALLVLNNHITFGVIVAFMIYVRLFTNPLSQIAQAMTSLQSTVAASERVFEFLDEQEMSNQKEITKYLDKSKVKGEIEFNHVVFKYDGNEEETIKDFSAKALKGEKIAIVGPTGAGKTTMVNLLMKFYEINSGDIKIDGVSIKELSRENIHSLFTMVLQDTWLFNGTVKENIIYNRDNVSDERVKEVCKIVGLDHFIKTLPKGYDSNISDNDSVSAGQRQLLTIARGMLEDAPFLILDEATSNVDTRTEELVQSAMDKLMEGRTSFIIAHRLSTIKNADLILVMKDGNIIETGNHEQLMNKKGFYADLYNSQFEL